MNVHLSLNIYIFQPLFYLAVTYFNKLLSFFLFTSGTLIVHILIYLMVSENLIGFLHPFSSCSSDYVIWNELASSSQIYFFAWMKLIYEAWCLNFLFCRKPCKCCVSTHGRHSSSANRSHSYPEMEKKCAFQHPSASSPRGHLSYLPIFSQPLSKWLPKENIKTQISSTYHQCYIDHWICSYKV